MSATPDIVISGLGLLTPFGPGVDALWRGLVQGRTALAPARRFTAPAYRGEPVGEVPQFAPGTGARKQAYASAAVVEALRAARLPAVPHDALVVLVGQAPLPADEPATPLDAEEREFLGPGPLGVLRPGRSVHLTHACASALFAIAFAREALREGAAPVAVVAGATALNHYEYASMDVVRAVDRAAARPFDTERAGISLGEGGGAVILESAQRARARGLAADLVVAGCGTRVAAAKSVASDETSVADCLREAMSDARADHLDHVHAHATGTPQGDTAELRAIEAVAAQASLHDVPVSSHKGAIGHLLHISGAVGLAAASQTLRTGIIPPTAGLVTPEATHRVRLPLVSEHASPLTVVAVNSFGFGGNNASVVLRTGANSRP
ncbi:MULTISPECIES: beta-ketoacyl synthase N-terminal-like domain-containing protein [Streptomyces]|uniref:beta-ketoacyl synthase N-terminal-like domain-containing protein n=1 Tax=Streptomyces TaxID=1883 RepID=UPI001963743D|nr:MULTISPECIES: beta-ketoacyl synthase N-terminal-like domain-containing protein [Streptomyces]QRX94977.1 3-oxoacyl-ACP synthase [Streptomyces noursei]UJB46189.1 3-oxoacyl-ACP synthase [Streptomyces sp. A1-5]